MNPADTNQTPQQPQETNAMNNQIQEVTFAQACDLALRVILERIECLEVVRVSDDEWNDADTNVDNAISLVHDGVSNMYQKAGQYKNACELGKEWFDCAGVVSMCRQVFTRPNSVYARFLARLDTDFQRMYAMVEFVDLEQAEADREWQAVLQARKDREMEQGGV